MSKKLRHTIAISAVLGIFLILPFIHSCGQQEETVTEGSGTTDKNVPRVPQTDQQAFYSTYEVKDPEKKLEDLGKFIRNYPESSYIESVKRETFKTAVKIRPVNRDKVLAAAENLIGPAENSETQKDQIYNKYQFIAKELLEAGILLDEAENFAEKSIETLDKQQFIENQKKQYAEWGKALPGDDKLDGEYIKERAEIRSTLGRIYVRKGKISEGEKILKEAYGVDTSVTQAAIGMAEIAESRGNADKAMEYLTRATLTAGQSMEDARKGIETLYRKTHEGSLDGLDEMLDTSYYRLFPNPVKTEEYEPAEPFGEKIVLAELYTGTGCLSCDAIDLAFNAILNRYSHNHVAVLMYHMHTQFPDPMANPSTIARSKAFGLGGAPIYAIDGMLGGGDGREDAQSYYSKINAMIEKRLKEPADIRILLDTSISNGIVKARVKVDKAKIDSSELKLQIALVEEELAYSGQNNIRIHPMVVRNLAGEGHLGFNINPAMGTITEHEFNLKKITEELKTYLGDIEKEHNITFTKKMYEMDERRLSVVAFIKDPQSGVVLQSAFSEVE